MKQRIVFLLDLDYFYAAVEERDNPALKGKPVIVRFGPKETPLRGVVSTCNYEARKFGIRSGMALGLAMKKCPECIVLQPRISAYEEASIKVMDILRKHAEAFEQVSIDEAFMEMTGTLKTFKQAGEYAKKVQQEVLDKTKLPCSIGVGPNKLIAKMAAGEKKPLGVTVVPSEEVKIFLWPKSVDDLYGVGPKTTAKLKEMGILTIGELATQNRVKLVEDFGKFGAYLHSGANGIDDSPVVEGWEAKSIGRMRTFVKDTADRREILKRLDELAEDIVGEANVAGWSFKTVTITIRYPDFSQQDHSKSFPATDKEETVKEVLRELLEELLPHGRPIRRIGLRISNLVQAAGQKKLGEFK